MGRMMEGQQETSRARIGLIDVRELTFETVAQVMRARREHESFEDDIAAALDESGGP
jgi:arginine deiminase